MSHKAKLQKLRAIFKYFHSNHIVINDESSYCSTLSIAHQFDHSSILNMYMHRIVYITLLPLHRSICLLIICISCLVRFFRLLREHRYQEKKERERLEYTIHVWDRKHQQLFAIFSNELPYICSLLRCRDLRSLFAQVVFWSRNGFVCVLWQILSTIAINGCSTFALWMIFDVAMNCALIPWAEMCAHRPSLLKEQTTSLLGESKETAHLKLRYQRRADKIGEFIE